MYESNLLPELKDAESFKRIFGPGADYANDFFENMVIPRRFPRTEFRFPYLSYFTGRPYLPIDEYSLDDSRMSL